MVELSEHQIPAAEMEDDEGTVNDFEAAAIMGVTDRTMRRWRERLNAATAAMPPLSRSVCACEVTLLVIDHCFKALATELI